LQACALESDGGVAALALTAVLPEVHVILLMASQTSRIEFHLVRGLFVATLTGQLPVRACQRKAGLLAVVKVPQAPSIRRMALGAVRPEAAMVDVVALVAVVAAPADIPILPRLVALLARYCHVQTHEWKICQVVIEGDRRLPTFGGMALVALHAELTGVDVARAMAGRAIGGQFLGGYRCGMTAVARHLLVSAAELPMSIACVLEAHGLPLVISMTFAALGAEPPRVRVLTLVAAEAILGNLVLQVAAAMAILAVDIRVCAFEGKTGLLLVIELRRLPARGGMTVTAFRTAVAPMDIVRGVAGDTFLRRSFVAVAQMTAHARHLDMLVAQWIGGFIVIEPGPLPGSRLVTSAAIATELTCVRLFLFVAIHAVGEGLAEGLVPDVTARAVDTGMCAMQWKIGALVIELLAAQLHDVRIATMVLRVAAPAFRGGYANQVSVKSLFAADVIGDFFVTVETQVCLTLAVAAVVAERALLLVLGMSAGEFSGHEQGLRVHGITAANRYQKQQQPQQNKQTRSSPHEASRQ